jgi:hypothetical protein
MAVPLLGLHRKTVNNKISLSMDRTTVNPNENDHVINITSSSNNNASSSNSAQDNPRQHEDQPSTSVRVPLYQPSIPTTNSRNSSFVRRGNGPGRRRSPLNSGLWISIELVLTVSQIIAAVVGLSLSRHEHPHAPLHVWIIGYASGCLATLPLLYWRFRHRNQGSAEQDSSAQQRQGSIESNVSSSTTRNLEVENQRMNSMNAAGDQRAGIMRARVKAVVEYFKMGLDCFFAVWFVVGNVWIFGGHSSAADAPNLYRLCIVFLTFSCIGYAMPFILCATICCCLPCIISVMGFREDLAQNRGATPESINSLPIYKFKIKKKSKHNHRDGDHNAEGGVVAAGTEKERSISGEDAVCCICLAKYANNDELRELPCIHFFHKDCVDKWLKINASCPLCKGEVGETVLRSIAGATASLQQTPVF